MANQYTVSNYLLPAVKRRGMIPSTPGTLTDADFLAIADEELQTYIVELLLEANEEFLVVTKDYSIAAGTAPYSLPYRCVAGTLRAVLISDSATGGFQKLPRIEPEREADYAVAGTVAGYKLEGNNVVLIPSPTTSTGTLRLKYELRPNRLVTDAQSGLITAINTGARQVTVSPVPSAFTGTLEFDFVRGKPHFDLLSMDEVGSVSGGTITFVNALPTGLVVGDYVNLAGESCIPQVPHNLHSLLVQRTKGLILEALGDRKAGNALLLCEQMRERALRMMVKRVPANGRYIINRYGPGSWRLR